MKIDPSLSLAITLHSNKGCYAVLLGSGVSRSSGIPTGWDIVLQFVRQVAKLNNDDCEPDPENWYVSKFGKSPDYSELLVELAKTPTERSRLLKSFFEPSAAELEEGKKVPTKAHKAIAELVSKGAIKVIVTTNFDRLMEQALQNLGIVAQVIHTADAVDGALPLVHSNCTIVKLHGDYLDTRIKNAPLELEAYDPRMNGLLDRILDEYGLIICGWSGDWDVALRAAFERCKGRRFSTYWVARGTPSTKANVLINLRGFNVISSGGADEFFEGLEEKMRSLEDMNSSHPLSVDITVATVKRYMSKAEYRIKLADLVRDETESAFNLAMRPEFLAKSFEHNLKGFKEKLHWYNSSMEKLLTVVALGCYWGALEEFPLWESVLERFAGFESVIVPSMAGPDFRIYPCTALIYAGGVACVLGKKYQTLASILSVKSHDPYVEDELLFMKCCRVSEVRSYLSDGTSRNAQLSEYLLETLTPHFLRLNADKETISQAFDRFECLFSLEYGNKRMDASLTAPQMPIGRFGWKYRSRKIFSALHKESKSFGAEWALLQAGLCDGNSFRFNLLLRKLEQDVSKISLP
jgi:hypothetical protein